MVEIDKLIEHLAKFISEEQCDAEWEVNERLAEDCIEEIQKTHTLVPNEEYEYLKQCETKLEEIRMDGDI